MKKLLFSFLLLSITHLYAQEVKLKDDNVIVNGKQIFKYEKVNNLQYSFYDAEGNEILMYKYQNNQTQDYQGDDYFTINFITLKRKVETSDFNLIYAASPRKNMQKLMRLLFKEKVFDVNGNINAGKLTVFSEKYNQEIK